MTDYSTGSNTRIKGTALEWLKSYIKARKQEVHIDDAKSDPTTLSIGVPQCRVLGPLLFLIDVLPLKSIMEQER